MCAKSRSALRRNYIVILLDLYKNKQSVKKKILTDCCGQRWIRTTEDERQQIYSLPHLATLEFAPIFPELFIFLCESHHFQCCNSVLVAFISKYSARTLFRVCLTVCC